MRDEKVDVQAFLRASGFDLAGLDPVALLADFRAAMVAGLAGRPGGLPMLPAFVAPVARIPVDERVIAIDAGGTNLRVAVVHFDAEAKPHIDQFARTPMPGAGAAQALSADTFFDRLAECVRPVADAAERIGFCFSFATDIEPDGDGRLRAWSKEINAPEVIGHRIGHGLLTRLNGHTRRRHRLKLMNDTVACLLAGAAAGSQRRCGGTVGFILGTGVNVAYFEQADRIPACRAAGIGGLQAINVEGGTFGGGPASQFDTALDAASAEPGAYRMEKKISGAYLGSVGLQILHQAAQDGLFGPRAARVFLEWSSLSTKELDDFLKNPFVDNGFQADGLGPQDRRLAMRLCRPVVERAALLGAVMIAAAVLQSDAGRDPLHPVGLSIEGSTFYRTWELPARLHAHLRRLLEPQGIWSYPLRTEDSPLIGAAVAGLTA